MDKNIKTEARTISVGGIYRHPKYKLVLVVGANQVFGVETTVYRLRQIEKVGERYKIKPEIIVDRHTKTWWQTNLEVGFRIKEKAEAA